MPLPAGNEVLGRVVPLAAHRARIVLGLEEDRARAAVAHRARATRHHEAVLEQASADRALEVVDRRLRFLLINTLPISFFLFFILRMTITLRLEIGKHFSLRMISGLHGQVLFARGISAKGILVTAVAASAPSLSVKASLAGHKTDKLRVH